MLSLAKNMQHFVDLIVEKSPSLDEMKRSFHDLTITYGLHF